MERENFEKYSKCIYNCIFIKWSSNVLEIISILVYLFLQMYLLFSHYPYNFSI